MEGQGHMEATAAKGGIQSRGCMSVCRTRLRGHRRWPPREREGDSVGFILQGPPVLSPGSHVAQVSVSQPKPSLLREL